MATRPGIRVFISHQRRDVLSAQRIRLQLVALGVEVYLDAVDPYLGEAEEDVTSYLQDALGECTHLLAAVSQATKQSWWVPFEIGLATEKRYPISTFAIGETPLPDYLKKWPYLRSQRDVELYVRRALSTAPDLVNRGLVKASRAERQHYSASFHRLLRRDLGQT